MKFLWIVFALKQFILRMEGKPIPVIEYPTPKGSLTDEDRVVIQKITSELQLCFERATLGLPGRTHVDKLGIQWGLSQVSFM